MLFVQIRSKSVDRQFTALLGRIMGFDTNLLASQPTHLSLTVKP